MTSELKEIREQLNTLEERLKALETNELKMGDDYFYIDSDGIILGGKWHGDTVDIMRKNIGNAFKTSDESMFAHSKLRVLHELGELARPFKSGCNNWYVFLKGNGELGCAVDQSHQTIYSPLYFDTKDEVREAVEKIGEDRIKKYLFGIGG